MDTHEDAPPGSPAVATPPTDGAPAAAAYVSRPSSSASRPSSRQRPSSRERMLAHSYSHPGYYAAGPAPSSRPGKISQALEGFEDGIEWWSLPRVSSRGASRPSTTTSARPASRGASDAGRRAMSDGRRALTIDAGETASAEKQQAGGAGSHAARKRVIRGIPDQSELFSRLMNTSFSSMALQSDSAARLARRPQRNPLNETRPWPPYKPNMDPVARGYAKDRPQYFHTPLKATRQVRDGTPTWHAASERRVA